MEPCFFGEDIHALVERQLLEKVGCKLKLESRGIANIRLKQGDKIVSHTIAYLFYGRVTSVLQPNAKDKRFVPHWISLDNVTESELMPDIKTIIERMKASKDPALIHLVNGD